MDRTGIMGGSHGVAHSKASWFLRTRPNVRRLFQAIYAAKAGSPGGRNDFVKNKVRTFAQLDDDERKYRRAHSGKSSMISSFDAWMAWRPWQLFEAREYEGEEDGGEEMGDEEEGASASGEGEGEEEVEAEVDSNYDTEADVNMWKPVTEGMHIDQNFHFKPDFHCVQSMIALLDVTKETGGLSIIPRDDASYKFNSLKAFVKEHPHFKNSDSDFCEVVDQMDARKHAMLPRLHPGDVVLWDSRTVHGGVVGTGPPVEKKGVAAAGASASSSSSSAPPALTHQATIDSDDED